MKAMILMLSLALSVGFVGCANNEKQAEEPQEMSEETMNENSEIASEDLELEMEEEAEADPSLGTGSSGRGH